MQTTRTILLALVAAALVAPLALANHTPPSIDTVDGGVMDCKGEGDRIFSSGTANDEHLPILRTTDNGHVTIKALGTANTPKELRCMFEVRITGSSVTGINPQGGLTSVTSTPCFASAGASCTAVADADWWITFIDLLAGIETTSIVISFDLVVNGVVVDSGEVEIADPSVPALFLP